MPNPAKIFLVGILITFRTLQRYNNFWNNIQSTEEFCIFTSLVIEFYLEGLKLFPIFAAIINVSLNRKKYEKVNDDPDGSHDRHRSKRTVQRW